MAQRKKNRTFRSPPLSTKSWASAAASFVQKVGPRLVGTPILLLALSILNSTAIASGDPIIDSSAPKQKPSNETTHCAIEGTAAVANGDSATGNPSKKGLSRTALQIEKKLTNQTKGLTESEVGLFLSQVKNIAEPGSSKIVPLNEAAGRGLKSIYFPKKNIYLWYNEKGELGVGTATHLEAQILYKPLRDGLFEWITGTHHANDNDFLLQLRSKIQGQIVLAQSKKIEASQVFALLDLDFTQQQKKHKDAITIKALVDEETGKPRDPGPSDTWFVSRGKNSYTRRFVVKDPNSGRSIALWVDRQGAIAAGPANSKYPEKYVLPYGFNESQANALAGSREAVIAYLFSLYPNDPVLRQARKVTLQGQALTNAQKEVQRPELVTEAARAVGLTSAVGDRAIPRSDWQEGMASGDFYKFEAVKKAEKDTEPSVLIGLYADWNGKYDSAAQRSLGIHDVTPGMTWLNSLYKKHKGNMMAMWHEVAAILSQNIERHGQVGETPLPVRLLAYDKTTRTLSTLKAGMEAGYIIRAKTHTIEEFGDKGTAELGASDMLGVPPEPVVLQTYHLEPGDIFIQPGDGITEAGRRNPFEHKIKDVLKQAHDEGLTPQQIVDKIFAEIDLLPNDSRSDDQTIFVFQVPEDGHAPAAAPPRKARTHRQ